MPSEYQGVVLHRIWQVFQTGTTAGMSEKQLIERFVSRRDEVAFETLVARHGGMVWGVCRRLLNDPHDVEDAFQATFLVLVHKVGTLQDADRLGPWLHGVALRIAIRSRRNAARRREQEGKAVRTEAVKVADPSIQEELRRVLDEEIDRLPGKQRIPVILCHLEGKTLEEAAAELSLTKSTVRGRLAQARQQLRARLKGRGLAPLSVVPFELALARPTTPPAYLITSTARTAIKASGTATSLAGQVLKAMAWDHLRGVGWVLGTLLAMASFGLVTGFAPPEADKAERKKDAMPPAAAAKAPLVEPAVETARRNSSRIPGKTRVKVVDAESGIPLKATLVRTITDGPSVLLRTNSEGEIELGHSSRWGDDHVLIDVWAEGHALQRFGYWGNDPSTVIPETIPIRLQKGDRLSGKIVNESGEPVPGATIYLWSHNYKKKDPHEIFFDLQATSDSNGTWETRSAPEITGELIGARVMHPDYIGEYNYQQAPAIAKLQDGTAVSVLKKGFPFSGRVLDENETPIQGALIQVTNRNAIFVEDVPNTRTDAQGHFSLNHLMRGQSPVLVQAPQCSPKLLDIVVGPNTVPVDIRLDSGKKVHGRVVDIAGKPIADAHFLFHRWKGYSGLITSLDTDVEGRFHWDGAPSDSVQVSLSHDGYLEPPSFLSLAASEKEIVFTLKRALTIFGTITDEATGNQVELADLEKGVSDIQGVVISWIPRREAVQSDEGRFVVHLDADAAPAYRIRVHAPGFKPFESRIIKAGEMKVRLDVKLKKDPRPGPSGIVFGPDGRVREGALVIMATEKHAQSIDYSARTRPSRPFVKTGPDGRFAFPPLDEPFALAVVDEVGFARLDSEQVEESNEIQLTSWGRIEGQLPAHMRLGDEERITLYEKASLAPKIPLPVEFADPAGREVQAKVIVSSPIQVGLGGSSTKVDDDGRFVFERVPPGFMEVQLTIPNGNGFQVLHRAKVEVRAGEISNVSWEGNR